MKWWRQNTKKFMNLQVRERKLIFYSTQVVVIWLAAVLLIEPLLQQTSSISKQNNDTEQIELELAQKIQQMTGSYISASQMLGLLEDLLVKMPEVQLAALENLPAQPVLIGTEATAQPLLYQHRTRLIFNGNFASLQKLLAQLQQLSWQLHWIKLDYKVLKYPEAQLQLELATVSESANYVQI